MNCPIATCKPQELNAIDATLWMTRMHMNAVTESSYKTSDGEEVFVCAGFGQQFEGSTPLRALKVMRQYVKDVYGYAI